MKQTDAKTSTRACTDTGTEHAEQQKKRHVTQMDTHTESCFHARAHFEALFTCPHKTRKLPGTYKKHAKTHANTQAHP